MRKKITAFFVTLSFTGLQAGSLLNSDGLETTENFRINSLKSLSERSGQIFAIPHKYNLIMGDYSHDGFSHIKREGKTEKFSNRGTGHGSPWDYDTHIPIIMYGPGFINKGLKVDRFTTQQDIPVTYAGILNIEPPTDAEGNILAEALKKQAGKPKAILTIVLDQVGELYYQSHPDKYPEIKRIMDEGTYYTNAKVTHLESETAVGHVAIGTGAYPEKHGIPANSFWLKGLGKNSYSFDIDNQESPVWLKSPTLADVYDLSTGNKALIISYCYAERASIGMAGHGAMYRGGDKDMVFFYRDREDIITTNEKYYEIPDYVKGLKAKPYLDRFTNNTAIWMDHKIPVAEPYKKPWASREKTENKLTSTAIFPVFEGDMFTKIIENEPVGQDDITDLIYLNLKSTDSASHTFGYESEEAGEVLREVDKQVGKVIRALEKKVGKDNIIVTITADHGGTPLPELSGGIRLLGDDLQADLNNYFDKTDNKIDSILDAGQVQITVDESELKRNGFTLDDVRKFLLDYKVNGRNFYHSVFTKDELLKYKYNDE